MIEDPIEKPLVALIGEVLVTNRAVCIEESTDYTEVLNGLHRELAPALG